MLVGNLADRVVGVVVEHGDNRLGFSHFQGSEGLGREVLEVMQVDVGFVDQGEAMRFEIGEFHLPMVRGKLPRQRQ